MLWENIISNDFPAAVEQSKGVCVVPIGCLEKHGPHSALGTDTIIATHTCLEAAKLEPVVIFPTMYFGEKSGSGEYPGTVIFSVETRWHIFRETVNEIYRNGFKKILFVNGHGGNTDMLGLFTRGMLQENPNVMLFTYGTNCGIKKDDALTEIAEDYSLDYLTEEDRQSLRDFVAQKKESGHACIIETAKAYHYCPESVNPDRITEESGDSIHRFDAFSKQKISSPFSWMANYPNSYGGSNEYRFNAQIARAITEYYPPKLAEAIRFLKNETISDEFHAEWLKKQ
jgi:creatinine amidohydrolase